MYLNFSTKLFTLVVLLSLNLTAWAQSPFGASDEVKKVTDRLDLKPAKTSNAVKLPIYLISSARDYFGDWNAIQLENQVGAPQSKERNVILTVESLIGPSNFKWSKPINIENNDKPQGFEVLLPNDNSQKTQLFGVFICRDAQKEGSCAKKPFETIDAILQRYIQDASGKSASSAEGYQAGDKLYYFSMFVLNKDSILAYKTSQFSEQNQETLKKLLISSYSTEELASTMRLAEERMTVLGSVPGAIKRILSPQAGSTGKFGPYMYWVDLPRMRIG